MRRAPGIRRRRAAPISALVRCVPLADGAKETVAALRGRVAEVLVIFDDRADDRLLPAAEPAVRRVRLPPWLQPGRDARHLLRSCSQPWVLWLDAGEGPAAGLLEELPRLAAGRAVTHWQLRDADGRLEPRLVRNDPAITQPARRGYAPIGPGGRAEHGLVRLPVGPAPAGPPVVPSEPAVEPLDVIDEGWDDWQMPSEAYTARIEVVERDRAFEARAGRVVHVAVENGGTRTWPSPHGPGPSIRVSYRWLDDAGDVVVPEGLRTPLPGPVGPGERAVVPVSVSAPDAGRYTLQLDLVDEGVTWFGAAIDVPVEVG